MTTDVIEALRRERAAMMEKVNAMDAAIAALQGTGSSNASRSLNEHQLIAARPNGVGDDKLDAVREYVQRMGRVRQSDVVRETGFNSGTVSVALHTLEASGEIRPGPKKDRSRLWEVVKP
jgi:hypothetical protein